MPRLRWALLLVGVVVAVLLALTAVEALRARTELSHVAADLSTFKTQLADGDTLGAARTLRHAQTESRASRRHTRGPGWWLTGRVPGAGDDVAAIQTVAAVSESLTRDVLPDVLFAAGSISPDSFSVRDGQVRLAALQAAGPAVVRASAALQTQTARVRALRSGELAEPIARPVATLRQRLESAAVTADRVSRAVRLLPPMLGTTGPRRYLLMLQNNAELRSSGGIPGAFAILTARDGRITLGRQRDASTFAPVGRRAQRLTGDERLLFGPSLGVYAQNLTMTPDFPRTAQLARAMLRAGGGPDVDGVLSADPVSLAHLLRGTGPVSVPGAPAGLSQVTADNAVRLLLSDAYARIGDPPAQNAYFDAVARSVFAAVTSGRAPRTALLDALTDSVSERRVLLWSAHPAEQRLLATTRLGGAMPTRATAAPQVGVFLDDGGASKLDYYLRHSVDVASTGCRGDRQRLTVTLRLRSRVPATAPLPAYVVNHTQGLAPRTIRLTLYAYAPIGGRLVSATYDGRPRSLAGLGQHGRDVTVDEVETTPGRSHTLTFTMLGGRGQTDRAQVRVTPGAHGAGVGTIGRSACG